MKRALFSYIESLVPVLALALLSLGCPSEKKVAEATTISLKSVKVERVGRQDITDVLKTVADLKPSLEVTIISPVPERILRFPWKNGDKIEKNQLVALIRKDATSKGLDSLDAQVEGLEIQMANQKSELARSQNLYESNVITRQTLDQIQTAFKASAAQRKALVASRGQLAISARNATIKAPIGGIIANKRVEVGDMASPQFPLCTIMVVDPIKVELKLMESEIARVRMGQEVSITVDAYPGEIFRGEISRILPYLNMSTRTNTVEVALSNPEDEHGQRRLKPGMFGRAELVLEEHKGVLVAPEQALLLDSELVAKSASKERLRKAFVVDDQGVAHKRIVRLAQRKGSLYGVAEGLNEGDLLVVRGQHTLKEGQKVNVLDRPAGEVAK